MFCSVRVFWIDLSGYYFVLRYLVVVNNYVGFLMMF